MADEQKKEEAQKPAEKLVQPKAEEKPQAAEAPKVAEAPKAAETQPKAPEGAKAPEAKKEAIKAEKPANCASCNKSIKNKRWYYRNGKYYCSKRCWQTAVKKDKAPAQEAAPQQ
jgi:hypothetical protein